MRCQQKWRLASGSWVSPQDFRLQFQRWNILLSDHFYKFIIEKLNKTPKIILNQRQIKKIHSLYSFPCPFNHSLTTYKIKKEFYINLQPTSLCLYHQIIIYTIIQLILFNMIQYLLISSFILFMPSMAQPCDILVAGGTLASLGAALNAPNHLKVCLVEMTSRLGGQLGDEGVWHLDLNWLYQQGYPDKTIAYNPKNLHPFLNDLMSECNTGDCWVSRNCFLYSCVQGVINRYLADKENLTIYFDTTIKTVVRSSDDIVGVQLITRLPISAQGGLGARQDCRSFDEIIDDWYTREPSQYYRKVVQKVNVTRFVIQASQYGDLLVLSNATYSQGISKFSNTCGQSIVFGIHEIYPQEKSNNLKTESVQKVKTEDDFSLGDYTAEEVWRYRRLKGSGHDIKRGQISLQNWNGPGNDYRQGYVFKNVTTLDLSFWKGGLNSSTLKQAQNLTLRYHQWFKTAANLPLEIFKNETKTCKGPTRLPYIRDGRRSVGYGGFVLAGSDVTGEYKAGGNLTANPFNDRMSIGMYNMDLHSIQNCTYPPFAQNIPLPFFIPLRAYSNKDISNMIVAGRSIAQQFFVSSATRTHASQFAMGAASIKIAQYMIDKKIANMWNLIDCPACITDLQKRIREMMPLQWTIGGKQYPQVPQVDLEAKSEQFLKKE